jgi:hypothetical protein
MNYQKNPVHPVYLSKTFAYLVAFRTIFSSFSTGVVLHNGGIWQVCLHTVSHMTDRAIWASHPFSTPLL